MVQNFISFVEFKKLFLEVDCWEQSTNKVNLRNKIVVVKEITMLVGNTSFVVWRDGHGPCHVHLHIHVYLRDLIFYQSLHMPIILKATWTEMILFHKTLEFVECLFIDQSLIIMNYLGSWQLCSNLFLEVNESSDFWFKTTHVGQICIGSHFARSLKLYIVFQQIENSNLQCRPPILYIVVWNVLCIHSNIPSVFRVGSLVYSVAQSIYYK